MSEFNAKVVLITGGTSGIGRATAVALARRGARVVVTGRRPEEGQATVRLAKDAAAGTPGDAVFVQGDVSKEADVRAWVDAAVSRFGRLDMAFNNAGVEILGPLAQATPQDYRRVFDINVLGVLMSMKHEVPAMLASGGGSIVNNASIAGSIGMAGVSIYVASKHAVIGLTRCAAVELAQQNIRVNAVSPAVIETDMFARFGSNLSPEMVDGFRRAHPMNRFGQSDEIAQPVIFLLSSASSFMTGHDLRVDGGYTVP